MRESLIQITKRDEVNRYKKFFFSSFPSLFKIVSRKSNFDSILIVKTVFFNELSLICPSNLFCTLFIHMHLYRKAIVNPYVYSAK